MPGGVVSISSNQLIGASGSKTITGVITIPTPVIATQEVVLNGTSPQILNPPATASIMYFVPSNLTGTYLTLNGQGSGTSDVVALSPTNPSLLSLPTVNGTYYLLTTIGGTGTVEVSYA